MSRSFIASSMSFLHANFAYFNFMLFILYVICYVCPLCFAHNLKISKDTYQMLEIKYDGNRNIWPLHSAKNNIIDTFDVYYRFIILNLMFISQVIAIISSCKCFWLHTNVYSFSSFKFLTLPLQSIVQVNYFLISTLTGENVNRFCACNKLFVYLCDICLISKDCNIHSTSKTYIVGLVKPRKPCIINRIKSNHNITTGPVQYFWPLLTPYSLKKLPYAH